MTISTPTRLLILDQDTLGENFIRQMLNPNGYEVIKVSSSAEGLLTARCWDPDVIIINIMQPAINGWKLCRKLREFSQAPILVLATVSDPKSIARWLDAGADDYLTKPFSSDVLVAHLQKLTRRTKLTQNSTPVSLLQ
jgi:two-component system response regulator MtrA